jgi:hypothetical protein
MATSRAEMKSAMFDVLSDDTISDVLVKKIRDCCYEKICDATGNISEQINELAYSANGECGQPTRQPRAR